MINLYVLKQWHIWLILIIFCSFLVQFLSCFSAIVYMPDQLLLSFFCLFSKVRGSFDCQILTFCATKNETFPQKCLINSVVAILRSIRLRLPRFFGFPGSLISRLFPDPDNYMPTPACFTEVSFAAPPDPRGTGRPAARQTGSCSRKSAGCSSGPRPWRRPPARKR